MTSPEPADVPALAPNAAPTPEIARPLASFAHRSAARLLDTLIALVAVGPGFAVMSRVLEAAAMLPKTSFGGPMKALRSLPSTQILALLFGMGPLIVVLVQAVLLATSGRTVGYRIVGIAAEKPTGGRPGIGAALRQLPILIAAGLVLSGVGGRGLSVVIAIAAWLLLGAEPLVSRLSRTRLVVRVSDVVRAFEPPRFSSSGFLLAALGLLVSVAAAGGARFALTKLVPVESTDLDIPGIVAAIVLPLVIACAGALAAYRTKRFLVGELALLSLLVGLLGFEAMALDLLPVPALQRFQIAGPIDWAVYAIGAYFGAVLFLIIGSAVGFMVASDRGIDASFDFEGLVARRHLRLELRHFALLAVIATLAPILVYGVVIWPVRTVWRLVRGQRVEKPLAPTVFMALLTIVGVMFGVMSLTVVLAVMGGFERDLKEKILGTNAHGVVHRYVGDFTEWEEVAKKVRAVDGVEGVTPFILSEVMITTDDAVTGSVLKGIDVGTAGQVTDLARNIQPGDAAGELANGSLDYLEDSKRIPVKKRAIDGAIKDEDGLPEHEEESPSDVLPGIVIGREMARSLRVWVGDRVTVMNPLGELGPNGPIPRSRVYRVAAVFVSGMYEYDSKFSYITLKEAQKFFRMGDSVSGLELRVRNVDEARPIMKHVLTALEGFPYRTKDWGEMNENLFAALRLERVVMFILLSFQVLIACICVVATLVMLVVEKRREVATLKAVGAREGSIMKLFVAEGLLIGAIGTFYGSAAGFLFCKLIEKYGVGLDPQVYYITKLPVVIEPAAFVSVAIVAMLLVFIATIYPARRGGSIAPVEGFREE